MSNFSCGGGKALVEGYNIGDSKDIMDGWNYYETNYI